MEIIQSIIYGIIQGLGEFLPISSTAHLILVPYFFNWTDPGLAFDVALHLGTLIAVVAYFWKDWIDIILNIFPKFKNNLKIQNTKYLPLRQTGKIQNTKLFWLLVIATIPGVIFGLLFESKAETVFRSPLLIAFTSAIMGLMLYLADRKLKARKDLNSISWKDSIWIGLSQAVAIIPGVSRSGATITTGLFLGLDRKSAARFSFLLSTPIILGAFVFKLPELLKAGINLEIILAILFSACSGFLAIKYLLKFIEKTSYKVFFWYRLALSLVILTFYFLS